MILSNSNLFSVFLLSQTSEVDLRFCDSSLCSVTWTSSLLEKVNNRFLTVFQIILETWIWNIVKIDGIYGVPIQAPFHHNLFFSFSTIWHFFSTSLWIWFHLIHPCVSRIFRFMIYSHIEHSRVVVEFHQNILRFLISTKRLTIHMFTLTQLYPFFSLIFSFLMCSINRFCCGRLGGASFFFLLQNHLRHLVRHLVHKTS